MASPTDRACYLFPALSAKPYVDNDSQRYDEDSEEKQARKIIERAVDASINSALNQLDDHRQMGDYTGSFSEYLHANEMTRTAMDDLLCDTEVELKSTYDRRLPDHVDDATEFWQAAESIYAGIFTRLVEQHGGKLLPAADSTTALEHVPIELYQAMRPFVWAFLGKPSEEKEDGVGLLLLLNCFLEKEKARYRNTTNRFL